MKPHLSLNGQRARRENQVFYFKTHDLPGIFVGVLKINIVLDLLQMYSAFSALCDVYCHFNAPSYKITLLRPENRSTISDYHDTRKKLIALTYS